MATIREQVIANLGRRKNREIREAEGFVTSKLAHQLKIEPGTLASTLRRMEERGEIQREVQGKRSYAIRLCEVETEAPAVAPAAPATNGRSTLTQERLDAVAAVLEEYPALEEENRQLHRELGKAEEKIEALELQIAALKRQVDATKDTAKLIAEIQERLQKIG